MAKIAHFIFDNILLYYFLGFWLMIGCVYKTLGNMCGNRSLCLLVVLCIGCLLFTTACSRYISQSMGGSASASLVAAGCHLSSACALKISNSSMDHFDWSTANLSKVSHQKTLLCEAVAMGDIDLLKLFLEYIKGDPLTYPPEKVIYLIAGSGKKIISGMKIPLLIRAVVKGDLEICKLLFDML